MQRRMPKKRITNAIFKVEYTEVNLDRLERFEANTEITPELLFDNGIVKQVKNGGVKILGNGEVTKAFTVKLMLSVNPHRKKSKQPVVGLR